MNNLPIEIMIMILDLLDFKSQTRFIFVSKVNKHLSKYWKITKQIHINKKVLRWHYYDNLENIKINKLLKIYPKKLRSLTFDNNFDDSIKNIPKSVDKLQKEAPNFRQNRKPSSIKNIKFGFHFNQKVDKLPLSIKNITFGYKFNQTVDKLPKSIKSIKFGHSFNKSIDKLPSSIKHIKFGFDFNQSVDKLPSSVKSIEFGWCFNQSVDKLPSGARSVRQNLVFPENDIRRKPSSIKSIKFGYAFNQSVDKLPSGARSYWRNPFFTKTDFPITFIN